MSTKEETLTLQPPNHRPISQAPPQAKAASFGRVLLEPRAKRSPKGSCCSPPYSKSSTAMKGVSGISSMNYSAIWCLTVPNSQETPRNLALKGRTLTATASGRTAS